MGCTEHLTKEHIANNRKNLSIIMQPILNQTAEETRERFDWANKVNTLKNEKYWVYDTFEFAERPSEKAKRMSGLPERSITKNDDIKRKGGTHIHSVLAELVDWYFNHDGDNARLREIESRALNNPEIKMHTVHLIELKKTAQAAIKEILRMQERIEKGGKVTVHLEQFLPDFMGDIAGKSDLVAVFSNNTGLIYDWKTSGRHKAIGTGKTGAEVVSNPFPYYDIRAYDISQGEYARIAVERFGLKEVLQNRLVPIAVKYKTKKFGEGTKDDNLIPEIDILISNQEGDFLKPIPVGGERSRLNGINSLIEKQHRIQAALSERLKTKISEDEKANIRKRIDAINRSIIKTLVDEDIRDIITTITNLIVEAKTRLSEPALLESGEINSAHLNDTELDNYYKEMEVYSDIVDETHTYFEELKKESPKQYTELKAALFEIKPYLDQTIVDAKVELTNRAEVGIRTEYKDEQGHLLPMSALNATQLTFLKISEINNALYKEVWKVIEDAQYEIKMKHQKMSDNVYEKLETLFKWADKAGISRFAAFDKLINKEDGNMYTMLTKEFYSNMKMAVDQGGLEGLQLVHASYEIKDKDNFRKEYTPRLEGFKITERIRHNFNEGKFEDTIDTSGTVITTATKNKENFDKAVTAWEFDNDMLKSPEAWLNKSNRKRYLKLKDSVVEANLSPEYRAIRSTPALKEFYDMWTGYMEEFADILGVHDYGVLPPNFIPNIRKEMVEYIGRDGIHIGASIREFMDSLNVREEDKYIGTADSDGNVRKIPILFLNKFRTKDHKEDLTRKSYELGRSLVLFGHMAYNYEFMSNIEPKIAGLKMLLGNPTPEQGGLQAGDTYGNRIKGKVKKYVTEEGRMSSTYKLLQDITDYYLYGIKFKEKSLTKGYNFIHLATKLKNVNSGLKLSFALIPAAGAFVAGKAGSVFTGAKGQSYTNEQYAKAMWMMVHEPKKYKALTEFIDAPNDNYLERDLVRMTASWKTKYVSSRTRFAPLRGVDASIANHITASMAQNWIVNEDGSVSRMTQIGKKNNIYAGKKTVLEMLEIDSKNKGSVKGMSKEGFKQFRAAVKANVGEIIGNMNPDDVGKADVDFTVNQLMAFKSWIPAIVQEYAGDLRWDETTQAMKWGRFKANLADFGKEYNYTTKELEDGKIWMSWVGKVVAPLVAKTVLDIFTFGLAPRLGMSRINEERSRRQYNKFIAMNNNLKDKVSYDHFVEAKQGQIKAALMQIRFILAMLALAGFLGGKGDDDKPRYYKNWVTRTMFKVFSKAGSELTFMWNPTEFLKLMANPFPTMSLLTLTKKTVFNGFDETRDWAFGEDSKQDKTPAFYYMTQWVYGGPQLTRFVEAFENMKKNPYSVFSTQTQ